MQIHTVLWNHNCNPYWSPEDLEVSPWVTVAKTGVPDEHITSHKVGSLVEL